MDGRCGPRPPPSGAHRAASAPRPYPGLARFTEQDAEWFYGREQATRELVNRVTARRPGEGALAVVGPSGSGKSSLLHAGLVPALHGPVVSFTPGENPLAELAGQLAAVSSSEAADSAALRSAPSRAADQVRGLGHAGLTLIIDQFEEIFVLCQDEEEQRAFIAAVHALAGADTGDGGSVLLVFALRADFYAQALRHPGLAAALRNDQIVVTPMTEDELRRAIVEPARRAGINVDDGLVAVLLRDLAPTAAGSAQDAAHDPGTLPLLSHTLLATWQLAQGGTLTVADYGASGGIRHAVTQSAESVYRGLTATQREAARRLFLRLVHLGDDTVDTRRRVRRAELLDGRGALPADLHES